VIKIFLITFSLLISNISFANLPVKMTEKGICFSPEHPSYEKVKNYIKTFKSLEQCLKSGGRIPERTS